MKALKLLGIMVVLTGVIYPLFIVLFSGTVDLALIGQNFTSERYFWPRPSAVLYDPMPSGASNASPKSEALRKAVEERKKRWGEGAPVDLLYASGSGLDPHISLEAAYFQIPRVAQARNLSSDLIKKLVDEVKEGSLVNVLKLNLALERWQEQM